MPISIADNEPLDELSTPVSVAQTTDTLLGTCLMEMEQPGLCIDEGACAINLDSVVLSLCDRLCELERVIASMRLRLNELEHDSSSDIEARICEIERVIETVDMNRPVPLDTAGSASRSRVFLAPRSRSVFVRRS